METLAESLEKHPLLKDYFQTLLFADDNQEGTIIFFADSTVLERLNNAKYLYFDGNFKVFNNSLSVHQSQFI